MPTTGGNLLMSNEFRAGPLDQSRVEARPDVLVYTTDPLAEDLDVTGRVRAHLTAATDAPTTDWVVRLCDVDTQGVSRNIVDGIVRAVASPGEVMKARLGPLGRGIRWTQVRPHTGEMSHAELVKAAESAAEQVILCSGSRWL